MVRAGEGERRKHGDSPGRRALLLEREVLRVVHADLAVDDLDVTVEKLRVTRRARKASSELGFLAAQLPSL